MKLNKESYEILWNKTNDLLDAATKHGNEDEVVGLITELMTEVRYAEVE